MKCDAKTFTNLYETVYKDLYRFALCYMKNPHDAEDAVSEAVMAAYENVHKLKKPEAFKSWMFTILSNVCKKKLKSSSQQECALAEYEAVEHTDFSFPLDIRKAFLVLTEDERMIVALSVFGGYNSKEIGRMKGLNANTVRSKRSRALEKMSCVLK